MERWRFNLLSFALCVAVTVGLPTASKADVARPTTIFDQLGGPVLKTHGCHYNRCIRGATGFGIAPHKHEQHGGDPCPVTMCDEDEKVYQQCGAGQKCCGNLEQGLCDGWCSDHC
jgi:hypothetical protein